MKTYTDATLTLLWSNQTPAFVFYRSKFSLITKACHTDPDLCNMFLLTCEPKLCGSAGRQKPYEYIKGGGRIFFRPLQEEAARAEREKNISPVSTQPRSKNTSVMVGGLSTLILRRMWSTVSRASSSQKEKREYNFKKIAYLEWIKKDTHT